MAALVGIVEQVATSTAFSGAVRVDRGDRVVLEASHGLARRDLAVPVTVGTRFAIASGTKGWTALTVLRLVEEGVLELGTTARSLLGSDLPLVADDVTVVDLLAHRSGVGDYLDEGEGLDLSAHLMTLPVHEFATSAGYLRALDGHPTVSQAGRRFAYNNAGYVLLALLAERAAGTPFTDLVDEHVSRRAGLRGTAFLRSDELPGDAAVGYLDAEGLRTNILHLPVVGSGDGGLFTTVAEVRRFWTALFGGHIVSPTWVRSATRVHSEPTGGGLAYGLGFWLDPGRGRVVLEGCDTGVSFRSVHHPDSDTTWTVVANTTEGAWPVARALDEHLPDAAS